MVGFEEGYEFFRKNASGFVGCAFSKMRQNGPVPKCLIFQNETKQS